MKKIIILLALVSSIGFLNAQEKDQDNIKTLFSKPSKIRGYIGPISSVTNIGNDIVYMSGSSAAGIFNDHLILGFYNLELKDYAIFENNNSITTSVDFEHRGLWLGYIFMPKRIIHINTNVQIGKGNLDVFDPNKDRWLEDDFVFVITPSLEIELNLFKFLRLGIGANYTLASDVDNNTTLSNNDLTKLGGFASLKFGWFR